MATKYITLKGKFKWAKLYEPDEFSGDRRYITNFYPHDGGEWEKYNKSGLQLKVKEDEDGKFITLRRGVKRLFGDDVVFFSPPEITGAVNVQYKNSKGEVVRSYKKGDDEPTRDGEAVIIANGSMGLVNIAVYDTQKGKGHRLENVKILDLVSMPDLDGPPDFEDEPKSKDEPKKEPEKSDKKEKEELNDDLPW